MNESNNNIAMELKAIKEFLEKYWSLTLIHMGLEKFIFDILWKGYNTGKHRWNDSKNNEKYQTELEEFQNYYIHQIITCIPKGFQEWLKTVDFTEDYPPSSTSPFTGQKLNYRLGVSSFEFNESLNFTTIYYQFVSQGNRPESCLVLAIFRQGLNIAFLEEKEVNKLDTMSLLKKIASGKYNIISFQELGPYRIIKLEKKEED